MARPATGEIIGRRSADRRVHCALRFRVNGQRYRQPLGAVSLDQARQELENLLARLFPGRPESPCRHSVLLRLDFDQRWA
jgi:hypothetical protein